MIIERTIQNSTPVLLSKGSHPDILEIGDTVRIASDIKKDFQVLRKFKFEILCLFDNGLAMVRVLPHARIDRTEDYVRGQKYSPYYGVSRVTIHYNKNDCTGFEFTIYPQYLKKVDK